MNIKLKVLIYDKYSYKLKQHQKLRVSIHNVDSSLWFKLPSLTHMDDFILWASEHKVTLNHEFYYVLSKTSAKTFVTFGAK